MFESPIPEQLTTHKAIPRLDLITCSQPLQPYQQITSDLQHRKHTASSCLRCASIYLMMAITTNHSEMGLGVSRSAGMNLARCEGFCMNPDPPHDAAAAAADLLLQLFHICLIQQRHIHSRRLDQYIYNNTHTPVKVVHDHMYTG